MSTFMTDYQIQESGFRCSRTGRTLEPGERFYSVLFDRDAALIREDISLEAWHGPPENAFSFWLTRVPATESSRRVQIDEELLFDCFSRLTEEPDPKKAKFRYIVALMLMRQKRLKFEEVRWDEQGRELLALRCPRTRNLYLVLNPQLAEQELTEVEQEVRKVFNF